MTALLTSPPQPAPMTIGDLLVLYERNHVAFLKTRRGISRRLQRYVAPLATVDLAALTRIQVLEWFHEIGRTRGFTAANNALQQLHGLYVKANEWEVYEGKNPAARIKRFTEQSRERFVQSHEMPYLLRALAEELPRVETYFLCLLFTGARRDEARTMKWRDLDLDRALWHKPTTKTGKPHTVPLPDYLVTRIQQLPRVTEWVFPSTPNNKNHGVAGEWSATSVEVVWGRIRRRAGLPDVRIHDLRRTAASWLSCHGENLPVIQSVLNHSSLAVTSTYARLSVAPVRRALNDQCARMLAPAPVPVVTSEPIEDWPG